MFIQVMLLILGFVLLVSGANLLVKGASKVAKIFHISEIVIGLTIVSLGTTLPELLVSIISATSGSTDIVMGNVIGSNLCNSLLILGVITILKPIKFEKITIRKNLPLLIGLIALILIMSLGIFINSKMIINKLDGYILLLIAVIYFSVPIIDFIRQRKKEDKEEIKENKNKESKFEIIKNMAFILLGGLALKYGGDFAVNSSVNISHMLNISERVIGLTVVAIGTSLPELITSIVAILKGDEDIAEGNIIGACIINSCLVLGGGAIIADIPLTTTHIEDLAILLICTFIIWLFGASNKNNLLNRVHGLILVLMYLIYSIRLFI